MGCPPHETEQNRIVRTNDIEGLIILLESGYDIEEKDQYNRSLIENASIYNRIEIVKILIEKKAKKNKALQFAIQNQFANPTDGYEPLVQLLEEYEN